MGKQRQTHIIHRDRRETGIREKISEGERRTSISSRTEKALIISREHANFVPCHMKINDSRLQHLGEDLKCCHE